MYDLFVNFCGVPSGLLESSATLQKAFAGCSLALACFSVCVFAYAFIVIFRGWK